MRAQVAGIIALEQRLLRSAAVKYSDRPSPSKRPGPNGFRALIWFCRLWVITDSCWLRFAFAEGQQRMTTANPVGPDPTWFHPPKFWAATREMSQEEADRLLNQALALGGVTEFFPIRVTPQRV